MCRMLSPNATKQRARQGSLLFTNFLNKTVRIYCGMQFALGVRERCIAALTEIMHRALTMRWRAVA